MNTIDKQIARQTFQMWLKWFVQSNDAGGQGPPLECPVNDTTASLCAIALYTGMGFKEHYHVTPLFIKGIEAQIDLT